MQSKPSFDEFPCPTAAIPEAAVFFIFVFLFFSFFFHTPSQCSDIPVFLRLMLLTYRARLAIIRLLHPLCIAPQPSDSHHRSVQHTVRDSRAVTSPPCDFVAPAASRGSTGLRFFLLLFFFFIFLGSFLSEFKSLRCCWPLASYTTLYRCFTFRVLTLVWNARFKYADTTAVVPSHYRTRN